MRQKVGKEWCNSCFLVHGSRFKVNDWNNSYSEAAADCNNGPIIVLVIILIIHLIIDLDIILDIILDINSENRK